MMHGDEELDFAIVAVKRANEAGRPAEEFVEPRAGAEENAEQGRHAPDAEPARRVPRTGPRTASRTLRRQISKVGAGCLSRARPVLCGGRSAMSVPTPAASVSKVFLRARARAARPIRSSTAAAGSRTPLARRWASIAWTMGSPRSVAHAASVPTRRQARQSANPKLRRDRYLCNSTACSRRVLIPLRVISESGGRHTELIGHECDHCPRRLFSRPHAEAGIPKEAQLDGLFVRISARSSPPST